MKLLLASFLLWASADLKVGDLAPIFTVKTHQNADFDLNSRKGKWTVLYFYPKAGTPGCTKQACAFRDSIKKIRDLGAEVYGISTDTVSDQAAFHEKHHLNFDLLADSDAKVTELYGSKMPLVSVSKRWTFIIDPNLKIKALLKNVDPAMDSATVAAELNRLQQLVSKPVIK